MSFLDSITKAAKDFTEQAKADSEVRRAMKAPVEGAITRYEVTYIGGLPSLPKKKTGAIGFNILPTCFVLKPTSTSKEFFDDLVIPYDCIKSFEIVKRTITNTEALLSSSSSDTKSLEQENNINITYTDENDVELCLRIEMLTGISVYGQAGKCKEMLDVLRQNGILDLLNKKDNQTTQSNSNDTVEQIKKLAELKDTGILTEEEFNTKKKELLDKI